MRGADREHERDDVREHAHILPEVPMPYPPKQEKAIFLNMKRKQDVRAARNFMRKHSSEDKAAFQYSRRKPKRKVQTFPGPLKSRPKRLPY